jgi:thymidylate kinase
MIIIVEGIDRVGKTTLCKKIEKECGYKYFKDNSGLDYFDLIKENPLIKADYLINRKFKDLLYMVRKEENLVIDRFHLTEFVYDKIHRNIEWESVFLFDEEMAKLDTRLILVESEDIHESIKQHGSDLRTHNMLFKSLFYASKIKNKYRTNYSNMDKVVEFISGGTL